MLRRFRRDFRSFNVQTLQIAEENAGKIFGDFPRRFFLGSGCLFHFILALVAVRRQMPHIRNIHDMPQPVAVQLEHAS